LGSLVPFLNYLLGLIHYDQSSCSEHMNTTPVMVILSLSGLMLLSAVGSLLVLREIILRANNQQQKIREEYNRKVIGRVTKEKQIIAAKTPELLRGTSGGENNKDSSSLLPESPRKQL
jgi:TctA family transporter